MDAGTMCLVDTYHKPIVEWMECLPEDPIEYGHMAGAVSPYGDGQPARRILEAMLNEEQS